MDIQTARNSIGRWVHIAGDRTKVFQIKSVDDSGKVIVSGKNEQFSPEDLTFFALLTVAESREVDVSKSTHEYLNNFPDDSYVSMEIYSKKLFVLPKNIVDDILTNGRNLNVALLEIGYLGTQSMVIQDHNDAIQSVLSKYDNPEEILAALDVVKYIAEGQLQKAFQQIFDYGKHLATD